MGNCRKITLNLEDFKSRIDGKVKYIGYNEGEETHSWGKIPYDITVPDKYSSLFDIFDKIPLEETESGYIIRYRNMMNLYVWLKKFVNSSKFYKLCIRHNNKTWISNDDIEITDISSDICGIFDMLPSPSDYEIGTYVWINDDYEKYINIFSHDDTVDSMVRRTIDFINLVFDTYEGKVMSNSIPYANIPVYLEENVNDMGLFTPLAEQWIPNKKYYEGEIVFYEEYAYKLYDNEKSPLKEDEYGKYYKGYYDTEDNITYFDETADLHWRKILSVNSSESKEESVIIGESKLLSLKRIKKDYDDEGNLLPFIVAERNGEYLAELPFKEGIFFTDRYVNDSTNEHQYGDYIETIENEGEYIRFIYRIKSELLPSGKFSGGIKYEERYKYETKSIDVMYNGEKIEFSYDNIIFENNIDYDNAKEGELYAYITITDEQKSEDEFQEVPYIKDEIMFGINDLKTDISDYNIERGTSAAYEIHNVLGECSSMDDLEKYRNDFFKIKNNENGQ